MPYDSEEQEMWTEMLQNTDLRTGMRLIRADLMILVDIYKPGKPWYSPDDFPFLKILENNYDIIKKEAEALRDHQEKLVQSLAYNVLMLGRCLGPRDLLPKMAGMFSASTLSKTG